MWLGMFPLGMVTLAALSRMRRNWGSPALQEEGLSNLEKASSVSRVKSSQSALRRLV